MPVRRAGKRERSLLEALFYVRLSVVLCFEAEDLLHLGFRAYVQTKHTVDLGTVESREIRVYLWCYWRVKSGLKDFVRNHEPIIVAEIEYRGLFLLRQRVL